MVLGALAAVISSKEVGGDAIGMLSNQVPALSSLILLAMLLSTWPAGAYGYYGMFLTATSAFFANGFGKSTPLVRAVFVIVAAAVTATITLVASGHLLDTVLNITLFLLYLLVPWTAINLTDYYVIHHGKYDLAELFKPRGIYGLANWPAIAIFAIGIAVQIPFVSSTLYMGPLVSRLGGADVSWIVGLAVSAALYYGYARWQQSKVPARTVVPSTAADPLSEA